MSEQRPLLLIDDKAPALRLVPGTEHTVELAHAGQTRELSMSEVMRLDGWLREWLRENHPSGIAWSQAHAERREREHALQRTAKSTPPRPYHNEHVKKEAEEVLAARKRPPRLPHRTVEQGQIFPTCAGCGQRIVVGQHVVEILEPGGEDATDQPYHGPCAESALEFLYLSPKDLARTWAPRSHDAYDYRPGLEAAMAGIQRAVGQLFGETIDLSPFWGFSIAGYNHTEDGLLIPPTAARPWRVEATIDYPLATYQIEATHIDRYTERTTP